MRIAPFRSLRPQPNLAARVASVPYDVVSRAEAKQLAQGNPLSFLRVVRPEIDLPDSTHPYDPSVYTHGREVLERLVADGTLVRDGSPKLYLYRLVMNHQTQIGVVACCHVDDYHANLIKKHEKTRPDKEDDRTRHVLALNANTGPVFLTHRDDPAVDAAVQVGKNHRPIVHFDAVDGVTHTVWQVEAADELIAAFEKVPAFYVADGHHRAASAARACATLREANPNHTGDEHYNWFLCVLFPASQLRILAYNRLVLDLGGVSPASILDQVRSVAKLEPARDPEPRRSGSFGMYLDGVWHSIHLDPASIDTTDPIRSLDVSLLHERILEPIFGVGDARTDPRLEFVGGIRGTRELARCVDEGSAAAGFSLCPTTIEQLMTVADAGLVMPPKSTWFEPKLRSGLFVNPLG